MHRAYILHRREYTDSRSILELWTKDNGRMAASARAARKKNSAHHLLFTAYEVTWSGRAELKTLTVCEPSNPRVSMLKGIATYCGLYINELILRLLPPGDPNPDIFLLYENTLEALSQVANREQAEPVLRRFEGELLQFLGFGVDYRHCSLTGAEIKEDCHYELIVQSGFVLTTLPCDPRKGIYRGEEVLAMESTAFDTEAQRRAAKYMMRQMLSPLLGARPLKSRELFS